jgi:hypothetical protein
MGENPLARGLRGCQLRTGLPPGDKDPKGQAMPAYEELSSQYARDRTACLLGTRRGLR